MEERRHQRIYSPTAFKPENISWSSFIVDGRKLESINQWFNKENAALQSIKDLQGIKQLTQCQSRLYINRSSQVRDDLNKAARLIIHHRH
ncbi:MAG: transposase [Cyanobacteria bacterium LVE1205-1]